MRKSAWLMALFAGVCLALIPLLYLPTLSLASPLEASSAKLFKEEKIALAQIHPPVVSEPVYPVDTSDLPPAPPLLPSIEKAFALDNNFPLPQLERTAAEPQTQDPLVQNQPGLTSMPAPTQNWEGVSATGVFPPDTDGQIGRDHYVQIVNASGEGAQIRVWDKQGNQLYNFGFNSMYPSSGTGSRCHQYGYGDPVVLYDQMADRWLITQFTNPPTAPYNECVGISKTGVPTSNPNDWWLYEFNVHNTKFNDYPKFAVWPDGYYMTANQFTGGSLWGGAGVWVFDRDSMLVGGATANIYFDLYNLNPNYGGLLPSNLMGSTLPPAGAPNYLMGVDMDWSGSSDVMHVFEVQTDWVTPTNSTVTLVADLVVAPFDWNFANAGADVPQPDTSQGLDGIADRLMMHLWYRNFGSHESLVVNHTVDVGLDVHGIRWYEIRGGTVDDTLADAYIYQQGTYAPDSHHRWMGSIAMDHVGNIALGYSIASSTLYPSIRYAGRLVDDFLGTLNQAEVEVIAGSGSQTGQDSYGRGRWGDYSAISVDPIDDCTFWYTQEYIQTTSYAGWRTRVAAFRFPSCTAGDTGHIIGTVTDTSNAVVIEGAIIEATNGLTVSASTSTQASGQYTFTLPTSIYTVTASKYGYLPGIATGVAVLSGTTTQQDFSLSPAPLYLVEGFVMDGTTGWPLYASLSIDNVPLDPIWNDPLTGYYSVTLPAGETYSFTVEAFVDGYLAANASVGPLSGNLFQDINLQADLDSCQAPGYQSTGLVEDFEGSFPPAGWTVIDNRGTGVLWNSCSGWSEGNYSGGGGECAGVSSDVAGANKFNTELRSPLIDVTQLADQSLSFYANYQDYSSGDYLDLDVSINAGKNWTNVLHWNTDQGSFRALPGVLVDLDLSPYLSGDRNMIRWRYYDPIYNAWDYYAEIDEVRLGAGCVPLSGGLLVGNVYDENTSNPVNGAQVSNQDNFSTTTVATPEDNHVPDGFFSIFSLTGTKTFTATAGGGYSMDVDDLQVDPNTTTGHDFYLPAGLLQVQPAYLEQIVPFAQQITLPVTLTNVGGYRLNFELLDIDRGYKPTAGTQFIQVIVPEAVYQLSDHTIQRYRHRPPYIRPEINFQVPQALPTAGFIDVLLLTPDDAVGGDISLITTTLQAFSDLNLSVWDAALGNPGGDDLLPFDVVIVGNDYTWSSAGMSASGVGDALADYLDGGGKVIDSMFVHDWLGWQLAGRYISDGYSPFTASTTDFELIPYDLGMVYLPDHPIMQGVSAISDDPLIGIGHQDVGIATQSLRLADWVDGQAYVSLKNNVVGINQLWFHGSNWSGDVPLLMINAIRYLAAQDAGWLTETPLTGELTASGQQVVLVAMNSADPTSGRRGRYEAELLLLNDTPYGALSMPVVMTVTVAAELYLPTTMAAVP